MQTVRALLKPSGLPVAVPGTTIRHWANGPFVLSKIEFTDFALGNTGDNASLGIGAAIFTTESPAELVHARMSIGVTHSDAAAAADTPDMGLGTVVASGAVAVLGGTATFENIITGQTMTNCTGTATTTRASIGVVTVDSVFLNIADAWANVTTTAITATGSVHLLWFRPEI